MSPSLVVRRVLLALIRPCNVESAAANASPISFNVSNAPSAFRRIASIRAVSVSMFACNVASAAARAVCSVVIAAAFVAMSAVLVAMSASCAFLLYVQEYLAQDQQE